jgi:hypothetical protein
VERILMLSTANTKSATGSDPEPVPSILYR